MTEYKLKRRGLAQLLRSEPIKADMTRRANNIMARAVATAPVGKDVKAKRYKDSFKVTSGIRRAGVHDPALDYTFKTSRAYARVENSKTYAVYVEYGTGGNRAGRTDAKRNTPRYRVLGRASGAGVE